MRTKRITLSYALRTHLERIEATRAGYIEYASIPQRSRETLIKRGYVLTRTIASGPDAGALVVSVSPAGKAILFYAERYATR